MIIGVPRETTVGERRVALTPELVAVVKKAGMDVLVQADAGAAAGFIDSAYQDKGARLAANVLADADVVLKVQPPTPDEIGQIKEGAALIGFLQPYTQFDVIRALAVSQRDGFRHGIDAAHHAGPADGRLERHEHSDGVQGGAAGSESVTEVLSAFDDGGRHDDAGARIRAGRRRCRPASDWHRATPWRCRGSVRHAPGRQGAGRKPRRSLRRIAAGHQGGRGQGGLRQAQSEEFYRKQQELLGKSVAAADVVITTALVPGKKAPILITAAMVQAMRPGSVIVDLATEQGGNCELTQPGQETVQHGVTIVGITNVASTLALHASSMFARTVVNFLLVLVKDGKLQLDLQDELIRGPLVTHQGEIVHETVKGLVT